MKFQFVGSTTTGEKKRYQFVGERKAGPTKKLREDLADTLVWLAQEWNTTPVPLEEAKGVVLGCIEQAEEEGAKKEETLRMKQNVANIGDMNELTKYIWNYRLRASGLSVNRIMRGK
jgi:hypothetical protein